MNTDFSAIKNFVLPFREGMGMQFRAEFFNLFNHAQFYLSGAAARPMQDIDSPTSFGVVTRRRLIPRVIQFALKLNF